MENDNKLFIVYDPIPYQKLLGEYEYERAYTRLLSSCLSENDALILLRDKKLWTDTSDKELEYLNKRLQEIETKMAEHRFNSEAVDLFNEQKTKLTIQKEFLIKAKTTLTTKTAEYLASLERYKFYIFLNTYSFDNSFQEHKYWLSYDEFRNAPEYLVNKLMSCSLFDDRLTEKNLRSLARSEFWRTVWAAARKNNGSILDRPLMNITDPQRILITWSIIYDSTYENPECPDQSVIEDDDLFDEWLKQSSNKRNSEKVKIKNEKIANSKEVGIMVSSVEDAKKVFELNDKENQKIIQERNEAISKIGVIKEGNLPDVKRDIKLKLNQAAMKPRGK